MLPLTGGLTKNPLRYCIAVEEACTLDSVPKEFSDTTAAVEVFLISNFIIIFSYFLYFFLVLP